MKKQFLLGGLCITIFLLAGCGGRSSNATSAAAPSATPGAARSNSAIPASAKVFQSLQDAPDGWSACSECAGGGTTSSFWMNASQGTPSLSGSSRQFTIAGDAWSDALWIHKLGVDNHATHFLWDFYVYFDGASAANVWSAEYDLWQTVDGQKHMFGSQCVFGENHWDVWDSVAVQWVNTGLACPRLAGDRWHHIAWDVERISATQYRYNTLWVDDHAIPMGKVFNAEPTGWSDDFGVQWQLDQNGNGDPIKEWVDKVTLTMW